MIVSSLFDFLPRMYNVKYSYLSEKMDKSSEVLDLLKKDVCPKKMFLITCNHFTSKNNHMYPLYIDKFPQG